jgi:xanthine/CO dehydrogenase XdhC/CoxF family maturation factor
MAVVSRVEGETNVGVGARLTVRRDQLTESAIEDAAIAKHIVEDSHAALRDRRSSVRSYRLGAVSVEVFLEYVPPPVPLVIFGAGYDAIPLVQFAKALGWHATVVDGRPAYATADRFPDADEVRLARPKEGWEDLIDRETVAVIMTHHYLHDLELLHRLLPSPARYIGLLGPKGRTERLLQDLAQDGVHLTPEHLQRLYAPIGLDIGAEAPEEVALAVIAEIRAVLAGRTGGLLRERTAPLHDSPGQ